jgi:hypothetical protein
MMMQSSTGPVILREDFLRLSVTISAAPGRSIAADQRRHTKTSPLREISALHCSDHHQALDLALLSVRPRGIQSARRILELDHGGRGHDFGRSCAVTHHDPGLGPPLQQEAFLLKFAEPTISPFPSLNAFRGAQLCPPVPQKGIILAPSLQELPDANERRTLLKGHGWEGSRSSAVEARSRRRFADNWSPQRL